MSLKVKYRHVVTVLELSGRICSGESEILLRDAVQQALHDGALNLLLDLRQVAYMDSTGLGELAAAVKAASRRHCEVKLLHVPPRVQDLMAVTHLASTFDIFTDETAAATTFRN
jgi:anti-sigma B factor antagonist